jgi:hypothetical protein
MIMNQPLCAHALASFPVSVLVEGDTLADWRD